jgi:hypothetical protein
MPFRFGVVTLTEATEAYARVRVELDGGGATWGVAAEMLAPKWFDKSPARSNAENVEDLRAALRLACALYLDGGQARAPFRLFADTYRLQMAEGARRGLNPLVAGYGPALLDRAVLDGVCRALGISVFEAVQSNVPGIEPGRIVADLAGFDVDRFLRGLRPAREVHARHTVGLVDPITAADRRPPVADGLPETLEEVVAAYGHAYFKLKVGGDVDADVARLQAIAAVLDRSREPYFVTLDGNEQYESVDAAVALWEAMTRAPALERLVEAVLFIEQPIARQTAFASDVGALAAHRPVIIDESDADLDAFLQARTRGYRGVSSKTCKGFYKSILNAARCARWNAEAGHPAFFMSAEDLTTQAGVAVQQDLALVSLLGLGHVERNGHHYVNGMAGRPAAEQQAFVAAHPDLYGVADGVARVRIRGGRLAIGSLACPGFGTAAVPDWSSMRAMPDRAQDARPGRAR